MADRRAQLALEEAILRDIEQLKEKAQTNKRAEEEELWARRKQQQEREAASGEPDHQRDRSPDRQKSDRGQQDHGSPRHNRHGRRPSRRQDRRRDGAHGSRGDSRPLLGSGDDSSEGRNNRKRRRSKGKSGGSRSHRSRSRSVTSSDRSDDDPRPREASAGRADSAYASPHADAAGPAGEELDLEDAFRGKRVRGRGALGSRMDEAGPYMAPPAEDAELQNEDTGVLRRRPVGPAKPAWLETKPADSLDNAGRQSLGEEPTGYAGVAGRAAVGQGPDEERRRRKKERREAKEKKRRKKEKDKARKRRKGRRSHSRKSGSSDSGSIEPD
ncbi:hypothetical protein N2152v2_008849 [Parachlorella kessleri]